MNSESDCPDARNDTAPPESSASPFCESAASPAPRPRRFNPWRMFVGSFVPNWLQCRSEISQGAKLAYARLAQHAGERGDCFPRQSTLAVELGKSERTANEYIRELVKCGLIEVERPGLGQPNRYFFLEHAWIEFGPPRPASSRPDQNNPSAPNRKNSSALETQEPSAPINEENQEKRESMKNPNTHSRLAKGIPKSLEEALEVARQLGIEEAFAKQEFHTKEANGWKESYGNSLKSWAAHLQARWPIEQRKRAERRAPGRATAKRPPAPPRHFSQDDYNQAV
jgi:hypothetical protein